MGMCSRRYANLFGLPPIQSLFLRQRTPSLYLGSMSAFSAHFGSCAPRPPSRYCLRAFGSGHMEWASFMMATPGGCDAGLQRTLCGSEVLVSRLASPCSCPPLVRNVSCCLSMSNSARRRKEGRRHRHEPSSPGEFPAQDQPDSRTRPPGLRCTHQRDARVRAQSPGAARPNARGVRRCLACAISRVTDCGLCEPRWGTPRPRL